MLHGTLAGGGSLWSRLVLYRYALVFIGWAETLGDDLRPPLPSSLFGVQIPLLFRASTQPMNVRYLGRCRYPFIVDEGGCHQLTRQKSGPVGPLADFKNILMLA